MASGAGKLDELSGIDFLGDDQYKDWTRRVIELMKLLTLEISAGKNLIKPLLEATPTAEGWKSNSLMGSRKAARTVHAKLGRAEKSLTFAAGQVAAAYRSFERDYYGEIESGMPQNGMRIGRRTTQQVPGARVGSSNGNSPKAQTRQLWTPAA